MSALAHDVLIDIGKRHAVGKHQSRNEQDYTPSGVNLIVAGNKNVI